MQLFFLIIQPEKEPDFCWDFGGPKKKMGVGLGVFLLLYPNGFAPIVGKEFEGLDAECPPVGF